MFSCARVWRSWLIDARAHASPLPLCSMAPARRSRCSPTCCPRCVAPGSCMRLLVARCTGMHCCIFFVRDVDNCADFPTRARSPPLLLHRMSVFTTLRERSVPRRSRGINGARRRPAITLPSIPLRKSAYAAAFLVRWAWLVFSCVSPFLTALRLRAQSRRRFAHEPVAPPPWAASGPPPPPTAASAASWCVHCRCIGMRGVRERCARNSRNWMYAAQARKGVGGAQTGLSTARHSCRARAPTSPSTSTCTAPRFCRRTWR